MNRIPELQNTQNQLERLSAQRELYSSAKRWYIFQLTGNVILPIALATISLIKPEMSIWAATFSILFLVLDVLLIDPIIPHLKNKAAKIQELFDCDILQIKSSPLKTSSDIKVEEVLTNYEAHAKIRTNVEKVRNWYPAKVGEVHIAIARIICQRTNCWWDKQLRSKYCRALKVLSISLPIIIIVAGVASDLRLVELVMIASALVPFFQFLSKDYAQNKDADARLECIHNYIENIWIRIIEKSVTEQALAEQSRTIQDEIFEHRLKSPLILNWIYNIFRTRDESLMYRTIDILVEEIHTTNSDIDNGNK